MRVANWPTILAGEIERWRALEFQWGSTDCCQFAGTIQLVITGTDRRSVFGDYDSEFGATRILVECGGMVALLTQAWGESKPIAYAGRGDIVMLDWGRGLQPAVCMPPYCFAPCEPFGLARRLFMGDARLPDAVCAWSI